MDCPYCKGSGILKHPESLALEVMRHLKLLASHDGMAVIEVTLNPQVADYMSNAKRSSLARMEADTHKRVRIRTSADAGMDQVTYRCLDDRGQEIRLEENRPPPPAPPKAAPPHQDKPEG